MKYLTLVFITLFLSSCCATKETIAKPENKVAEIEKVISIEDNTAVQETTVEKSQIPKSTLSPIHIEVDIVKNAINPIVFNHNRWNTILKKHVTNSGNVNYSAIKNDPTELRTYIDSLRENLPTEDWSKEDKLAYWMNAYNAMTIDLIVRNYPVKSIKDIKDPWQQRLWKLGNKWYNLDEIEHQVLRKMNEPRIHFGIVCASYSCPKLQNEAFTALQLEKQLTKATREFLADPNRNIIRSDTIKISKIFQWFSKDFKQSGSIIDFLNQYSDVQISTEAKTSFKDYNWNLNE